MSVAVIEQNLHFLRQGATLLQRFDDETFAKPTSARPRAAGIGPHFRHCLDFYRCFLRDLPSGRIDYDRRERQLEIETRVEAAQGAIASVMAQLDTIADEHLTREIAVHHDAAPGEGPATAWHRSTVSRELRFLASHTVHHYALIAELARAHGIEPVAEFGVAPATLEYWTAEAKA